MVEFIIPAFISGFLMFFAPCTLPMVPGFLGFISGVHAKKSFEESLDAKNRLTLISNTLFYVLGFSSIFISLGLFAGTLGGFFQAYRSVLGQVGGVFIILLGLYMMHIFSLPLFSKIKLPSVTDKITAQLKPGTYLSSYLFGITFGLGWSPCIGPILGTVLFFAAQSGNALQGGLLLAIFSLGLAVPFMVLAGLYESMTRYIRAYAKYADKISFVSGLFLLAIGALLVTGDFYHIAGLLISCVPFLEVDWLINYL